MVTYYLDYGSDKAFKSLESARKEAIKHLSPKKNNGVMCIWSDNNKCPGAVKIYKYDGITEYEWVSTKGMRTYTLKKNGKLARDGFALIKTTLGRVPRFK